MMTRPPDDRVLAVLAKLVYGHELNGEVGTLPEPYGRLVRHIAGLPVEHRGLALAGFVEGRLDADDLLTKIANIDPSAPLPSATGAAIRRTAHLGDLAAANEAGRFTWNRWIVRGHFTLLTSEPKVGKTRVGMEIARRVYKRQPWPDGQEPTFPEGTKTLWVPGDRQQDELRDLALAYGIPPEAVLLNASPDEPYGGVSLDDPENVEALRERVAIERPGLVFIDTVWRATRRKLCREDEVNILMDPIIAIAQECDVAIVGKMHASKDGETLGRRLEGLARAVLKLSRPDPEGQPARRKLWVERANFLEPPPLGVTLHEKGCNFDHDPPSAPEPARVGRPPEKTDKAIAFVVEKLSAGDGRQCDLISEWEALGEAKGTIFNAFRVMQGDGRLVIDDAKRPKVCHLVRNPSAGQEPDS